MNIFGLWALHSWSDGVNHPLLFGSRCAALLFFACCILQNLFSHSTIREPNLEIFLDIIHICSDLSVKSGGSVTSPGNNSASSIARMLLNCLNFCKILVVQNRRVFFRGMVWGGRLVWGVFADFLSTLVKRAITEKGKCAGLEPSHKSSFSRC